jgi:hypothetical protein
MYTEQSSARMLTFRGGGWVIVLAALISLTLTAWAVVPALRRTATPSPGDGVNPDSYGFDLSSLAVPRDLLATCVRRRDVVPVLTDPPILPAAEIAPANQRERRRYLVPGDRVIGVELNGEARAYPLSVMTVHEIVNDTLGGVPIAVTYHWPCDSVVIFDRRVNGGTIEFGASGLVYNSNMLMYDRAPRPDPVVVPAATTDQSAHGIAAHAPSLWSQLLGRAVAGPAAERGGTLEVIPAQLVSWQRWLDLHPATTVLDRHPHYHKLYAGAAPTQYFQSQELIFPVRPLEAAESRSLPLKERVIVLRFGDVRRVYAHEAIIRRGGTAGRWSDSIDPVSIRFAVDEASDTIAIELDPPRADLEIEHAFWFAWHAMHPGDALTP